jgi:hypothetical protein
MEFIAGAQSEREMDPIDLYRIGDAGYDRCFFDYTGQSSHIDWRNDRQYTWSSCHLIQDSPAIGEDGEDRRVELRAPIGR